MLAAAQGGLPLQVGQLAGVAHGVQPGDEAVVGASRQDGVDRAGVARYVVVSIIGIEKSAGGYGAAKLAHEQAVLAGPVPATILRVAQFHELVGVLMDMGRQGEVIYLPRMRTQEWLTTQPDSGTGS
jgi:uncharacterized protein YbjT (DUF2867 family)